MTNKARTLKHAAPLLFCAAIGWSTAGRADELVDQTPLVYGASSTVTEFTVTGPGTVTVTLSDLSWSEKLASLSFAATTPTAVLATMSGPGQISFQVGAAGTYSAVVGAVASPTAFLDLGWYSMTVNFSAAPAVPLPASVWLVLSGVLGLAWVLRPGWGASAMHRTRRGYIPVLR